jgi:hypothetical protein
MIADDALRLEPVHDGYADSDRPCPVLTPLTVRTANLPAPVLAQPESGVVSPPGMHNPPSTYDTLRDSCVMRVRARGHRGEARGTVERQRHFNKGLLHKMPGSLQPKTGAQIRCPVVIPVRIMRHPELRERVLAQLSRLVTRATGLGVVWLASPWSAIPIRG